MLRNIIVCLLYIHPYVEVFPFSENLNAIPNSNINLYIESTPTTLYYTAKNNVKIHKPNDYYIDRITGKILGKDRARTKNLRVIDKREWHYVKKEKGGTRSRTGTTELHKNSSIVTFDEIQIQKETQALGDDTAREGIEHQLYIVLDVNTGKVFAKRELNPKRTLTTNAIIETYYIDKKSAPRIAEGLMLLAEMHGHPKTNYKNEINIKSASKLDKKTAKHLNISIFIVDAFDTSHGDNFPRAIHRVNKRGAQKKYVGQTYGTKGINTFNFTKYFTKLVKRNR
jgi:hypothetical protein